MRRERKEFVVDTMPPAQAVEALIHEYGKLVFHTIYGLTGDWEESEDLTQDTFHQALKSIDAARAKSGNEFHAKAWLLRIALNTVRMQRRRRAIFRYIPFSLLQKDEQKEKGYEADADVLNERAAPLQPAGFGAAESVDLEAFVAEQDTVQRTMARLTENLRICLLLSVVACLSSAEIAEMLHLEEATVRQRLARARKQFKQFYALESGEEVIENANAARDMDATQQHQNHLERVESHSGTDIAQPSPLWRNHAERFYRDPAATPLW
jgi:RNA polymerase sigma factor (sigma-70 family)